MSPEAVAISFAGVLCVLSFALLGFEYWLTRDRDR